MGGSSSKTYVYKPHDYAEIKKDTGISLEQYLIREMIHLFQISQMSGTWKRPIDHMITLIRSIHLNQEIPYPIVFEIIVSKDEILVRLKKYPL